ncbi:MAG: T9SS type A sorting domain-containing protein [Gemmatimonadota bacterium]|nr:MAG: T9SS type A sorting domain-containing protein [Gemmatimonadota bacterium]
MASLAIDTLWYSDRRQKYIGKTTTSGYLVENIETFDSLIRDIAWDGTHIWAISLEGTIKKFSTSGDLIETYAGLLSGGWGLTYDGAYVWASDPGTNKIYKLLFPGLGDKTPPSAPALTSDTHPSQDDWYRQDSPTLNWTPPADPSGISGYSYAVNHESTFSPDTTSEGWLTTATYSDLTDGTWYFHCRARDGVGNWSTANHYRIRIDTQAPAPPINPTVFPSGWTNDSIFQVHWTNPPDSSAIAGVYYKIGPPPEHGEDGTFSSTIPLFLAAPAEGENAVHLWLEDGAGNKDEASRADAVLPYDATGPQEGTILINAGAEATVSTTVTLANLNAVDALSGMEPGAQMRFSNDGTTWSPAEDYTSLKTNWDLSSYGGTSQPGPKTVSVIYRDAAGNWSDPFSDDILLSEPLAIVTDSLPGGAVGFAYEETLVATGGVPPYSWSISSGALPNNLTLTPDGTITGVPDEAGPSNFIVEAIDPYSSSQFRAYTITIFIGATKGDINGDSEVDLRDILPVVGYILGRSGLTQSQLWSADAFPDGSIDLSDLVALAHLIVGQSSGAARVSYSGGGPSVLRASHTYDAPSSTVTLFLDNGVPVGGLQLEVRLPRDATLRKPPQVTDRCGSFTVDYTKNHDDLTVLTYTLNGDAILPGSGPLLMLSLSCPEDTKEQNAIIEKAFLVGVRGEPLPLDIRTESVVTAPVAHGLARNYPNPFNPETSISFSLPAENTVSVIIYDALGRRVRTIAEETLKAGVHTMLWDGRDEGGHASPSGVYYCRIDGGDVVHTLKLALIR